MMLRGKEGASSNLPVKIGREKTSQKLMMKKAAEETLT